MVCKQKLRVMVLEKDGPDALHKGAECVCKEAEVYIMNDLLKQF